MKDVQWFSFTSDIWSTEVSNDSLLSLTAHWLTESFEKKYAMLHAQSLPGSHTGAFQVRGNAKRVGYTKGKDSSLSC